MNNRIQQFLSAENITQSQLADTLGVARASISHIISGRNKPGFDFIESMARHYPALSLEWLITGSGRMYRNTSEAPLGAAGGPAVPEVAGEDGLFGPEEGAAGPSRPEPVKPLQERRTAEKQPLRASSGRIAKMIVLFEDGSYQELK